MEIFGGVKEILLNLPMTVGKKKVLKPEFRVLNADRKLYDKIVKLAKQENRSLGRQIEYMLAKYCEEHKI